MESFNWILVEEEGNYAIRHGKHKGKSVLGSLHAETEKRNQKEMNPTVDIWRDINSYKGKDILLMTKSFT